MRLGSWLESLYARLARPLSRRAVRRRRTKPLFAAACVEGLEPRSLLSAAAVGGEVRVNSNTPNTQAHADVAMDAQGNYVAVWQSYAQDGANYGIYAQRYNASGVAQGSEFRVNTYTTGAQTAPSIAMDSGGDFVVTWTSSSQDGSAPGVYAQRYNASGVAQGSEFRVNTFTTGAQSDSVAAMDSAGDFVITWESAGQDGSGYGVYAQRYNPSGVAQGTEFRVNSYTTGDQTDPSIAMDATGDFVAVWTSGQDNSGDSVFVQRFNAAGVAQGSPFRANTYTTNAQNHADVAMDTTGDFVVVWQSSGQDGSGYGVYGQRFSSFGLGQGNEFAINTTLMADQQSPSVTMNGNGDFTTVWQSSGQDGDGNGIFGQRYKAAGTADGKEFRVNVFTTGNQSTPAVSMDSKGDFIVGWQSSAQDGAAYGIYAQRYQATVGPIITSVQTGGREIHDGDRLAYGVDEIDVYFSETMSIAGNSVGAGSVRNASNWKLLHNGVEVNSPIFVILSGNNPVSNQYLAQVEFAGTLDDGIYQLIATPKIRSEDGDLPLDGDDNGISGGNFQRTFIVSDLLKAGGETTVNSYTTGDQRHPAVASDAQGNYVIAWESSSQDGSSAGIYAQRYNKTGIPQGAEFRVNTYTTGQQTYPAVAVDATGDFIISWTSNGQDGGGDGIYAKRFNSAGAAQGTEFRVNNFTPGDQSHSTIGTDASGNFTIAWQSQNQESATSGWGIYAQRYNATGNAIGTEFRINSFTANDQSTPALAMNTSGDFVVAWSSVNQESAASSGGIYAQRYNAAGVAQGSEFQVNTYTIGMQNEPSAAIDAAGDFVITWTSTNQEGAGSGPGIYFQSFDAAGFPQAAEKAANTFTIDSQSTSRVAMDAAGDFTVVWQSYMQDGDSYGIYSRPFTASTGSLSKFENLINTTKVGIQQAPAISIDPAGDVVYAWESLTLNGYEIVSQRNQTDVAPLVYGLEIPPVAAVATLNTPVTSSLLVYDQDDDNWTGATVQITTNYINGQDVLVFNNQLGITGSWDASTGTLSLSGVSSVSNYRTALRNVMYHNTSATPNSALTRTVSFRVNDGLLPSNEVTRDLNVVSSSLPPALSGVSGTGTYFENAAHLAIAASLAANDPDSVNLSSATVSFTNWQAEDRVDFNNVFALAHTFTQDLAAHTAMLTISGIDTVDHYQTLLRSVVYWNVSDAPITTTRVANFAINDGLAVSNVVSRNLAVSTVNDAPLLSAIEGTPLAYKANDPAFPAQAISGTLLVADADSNNLSKATVQITAGYQNNASGHDVLNFTNQLGITGSFNAATGTLTLSGTTSLSNYRTALRSVTFSSSGSAVSLADRTLSIIGTDDFSPTPASSLAVTRTVTVSTANVPPGLTGIPATALTYVRGAAAVAVAPSLVVFDPDSINLTGATVQMTGNYQSGQDVLTATNASGITASFNSATGTLTLSGMSSLANYQTVLRSVTYKTNTAAANTSTRTLSFVLNDSLATSTPVTRNITLT